MSIKLCGEDKFFCTLSILHAMLKEMCSYFPCFKGLSTHFKRLCLRHNKTFIKIQLLSME